MNVATIEVSLLCIVVAILFAFAIAWRKRLQLGEDFILGRRRLSGKFAAIAIATSAVPVWWLALLMMTAYSNGGSAVWVALALVSGLLLVGFGLAPRLRARAHMQQCDTITQLLSADGGEKMYPLLMRSAVVIVLISLGIPLASQLQLAAGFFSRALDVQFETAVLATVLASCLLLLFSGFWITLIGDVAQWILLIVVGVVFMTALFIANAHAGTMKALWPATTWFDDQSGVLKLSLLVGIGYLLGEEAGQSALLLRVMASKDEADLANTRKRALLIASIAMCIALTIGWAARAMNGAQSLSWDRLPEILIGATSLDAAAILFFFTVLALTIAMLNSFHTLASHVANDLRHSGSLLSVVRCRLSLVLVCAIVGVLAFYLPKVSIEDNFNRMLFGWQALGSALGPLVIVRLSGKRIRPGSILGAMWSGFLLTVVFHLMPSTPGELLERSLPFTAALGIALSGGERRRNPDRADRGERTIHDRLPI